MTARLVRITVDSNRCVGSRGCVLLAPEQFALVNGKAVPASGETALTEAVADAVLDCPSKAITAWNPDTGEPLDL